MAKEVLVTVQPITGEAVYIEVQQDYAPVQAVNGRIGFVTLGKSDVGLSNVENLSILGASGHLQYQIDQLDTGYASQTEINILSGLLAQTGSNLNSTINSLSGYGNSTFSTITNLRSTGLNLQNQINNLSGYSNSNFYPNTNPSGFITGVDFSAVVYTTGNQTVSGIKAFTSRPTVNNSGVLLNGEAYPSNNPSGYITSENVLYTTGDQTIIGLKNFTGINSTGARSLRYNSTDVLIEGDAVPAQKYISISPFTTGAYNPYYQLSGATYLYAISYIPTNGNILLPQNPKNNTICEIEIPNAAPNGGLNLNIFAVPGAYPTFPLASVSGNSNILGYIKFAYIDGNWRKYPTVVPHRSTHSAYGSDPIFAKDINAVPELSYYYTNKLDADVTVGGSGIYETNSQLNGKSYWTSPVGAIIPALKIYWNNTNNSWEIGLGPGSIVFVRSFNNVPEPYIATGWQSANYGATLRSIRRLPYVDITNQQIKGDFLIDNVYAQNLVYHSGNQTISGVKNFISRPTVNGTGVLLSGEAYPSNNPSGYINSQNVVYTTGNQTISGIKNFIDNVYIKNLFVTGTETIVSTTNFNVQSPYLILNLTGGAVDGGIFFVTGSGLSGINDYGPIIGFDHTDKFKFGIARRSDDLSVLNDIAAVQDVTNYSGFVNSNFYPRNNPSGFVTGIDLSALYPRNNPSGFITNNNVVFTTGDQTISGSKTFVASRYIFSGANVIFVNNTGISSGYWQFTNRPTVNGTGVLLSGESILANQISNSTSAGRTLLTSSVQGQRDSLSIFPAYDSYKDLVLNGPKQTSRVYVTVDNWRTYTWSPSQSQYIEVSPSNLFINTIFNSDFNNLNGLTFQTSEWLNGVPTGWSGNNTSYTIYSGLGTNNFVANIGQLSTGPSGNSFRQNLGRLPITSNVELTFTLINSFPSFGTPILNAAIYDSNYNNLATGSYITTNSGTFTLTGNSIPANTNIIVGFWTNQGNPALDNVFVKNTYTNVASIEDIKNIVYNTGDQTISGNKNFVDNVYIKNLFVTGTETIVSTTNFNVQSPYLILNLTGGAVDGGIFFVTGSGLSGINDYGPIIGFDHMDKFKFGIARRSDDLSTLNDIAAVQDVTNYSGFADSNFYPKNNPSGYITGVNLSNYVTKTSGQFLDRPTVNGTGVLLQGESVTSSQISDSTSAGRTLLTSTTQGQRESLATFATANNFESLPVTGLAQRVYITTNDWKTYAWITSLNQYIEISPSMSSAGSGFRSLSVINGDFSDLRDLTKQSDPEWWSGVPFGWSGVDSVYTIYSGVGTNNYVVNVAVMGIGPSGNSFRQNVGKLPITSNVELTFTCSELFNDSTLKTAIYDQSYNILASGEYPAPGTYILTGNSIPANTDIIVGFWPGLGNPVLDNVSVSQVTSATTFILPTNLPRNNLGLPSGALWVDPNAGNVLKIV